MSDEILNVPMPRYNAVMIAKGGYKYWNEEVVDACREALGWCEHNYLLTSCQICRKQPQTVAVELPRPVAEFFSSDAWTTPNFKAMAEACNRALADQPAGDSHDQCDKWTLLKTVEGDVVGEAVCRLPYGHAGKHEGEEPAQPASEPACACPTYRCDDHGGPLVRAYTVEHTVYECGCDVLGDEQKRELSVKDDALDCHVHGCTCEDQCLKRGEQFIGGVCDQPRWKHSPSRISDHDWQHQAGCPAGGNS